MHDAAAGRTSAPKAAPRGRRTSGIRALTYVELLVSLLVVTLLTAGMMSAMLIATRALPDAQGADAGTLAAQRALDELASDLADAISIAESTASSLTFVVPDRTGDGQP